MENKITIKEPYRTVLLVSLIFLLIKNLLLLVLLTDVESLIPAAIHIGIIYLIRQNHRFTEWAIRAWAIIYLLIFTGIKAGAKTLIILRGDGWEISSTRYYIDLFLVGVGIMVLIFSHKIFSDTGK